MSDTHRPAFLLDAQRELLANVETATQLLVWIQAESTKADAPVEVQEDLKRIHQAMDALHDRVRQLPTDWDPTGDPEAMRKLASHIRHDLITPVGQWIGFCEWMLEETEPEWLSRLESDLRNLLDAARQVKARIERIMQGRIEATPSLALPPKLPATAAETPRYERPPVAPGRILAVDDNPLNCQVLERFLGRLGHCVVAVESGELALTRVRSEPFDLILLDILMPGLNGFEVLERLKSDPQLRYLPVIMITAIDDLDSVAACIRAGAEDYLPKPFKPDLLEARVGACLEKKRLRDREVDFLLQIQREKDRYNQLLLSMLPEPIVAELKQTETVLPRRYEHVAVLFADIVGFTRYCDRFPPEEVVPLLKNIVAEFERAALSVGVQKIKTVGDAFVAVAGLLAPVRNPVRACVEFGEKMLAIAQQLPPHWQLRIGIHCGSLVAGLLGTRYDLFDVWGDTVNTAARIESNGQPGAIILSKDAWEWIANEADGQPLGSVVLKGKGEFLLMKCDRLHPLPDAPTVRS
ncbi:adenylate/guanylate cyclase domain-containing protein [Tuwongella immobilis]|uniref:Guanylate cyclase n=1 Tax=Tuwongella immobilis TaxID=692036 RepID=A0A6C2YSH4_9BACT|nr:adenylate/guanylate cyclase domain-containing protein [Tuwongella immobilis]VIP04321.1 guanylate cyclase : Two-component hybrid sensor and regulator OS=Rhizobium sp. LPU83 GN=LPU83_pLPU83d_0818 PE=4 SV=1: Response_reg: Guanylate_cyc [Tuwongella immobilis]VTS06004.1 guanylate cyclase : Two-component hybrid sensor and regulator OS=Rhizobium sp. LPU83 GN=LPU83_pLPU83d_0818 PE=4 SV=1: Response_reg: Guanylate_cyc [Tuwongella immobilis]